MTLLCPSPVKIHNSGGGRRSLPFNALGVGTRHSDNPCAQEMQGLCKANANMGIILSKIPWPYHPLLSVKASRAHCILYMNGQDPSATPGGTKTV